MTLVPLGKPRAQVESIPGGLRVVVRPRRHVFPMLFLPVWLVGWGFGLVSALGQVLQPDLGGVPSLFLLVWLVLWTFGGAFALLAFLWMAVGREVIEVGGPALRLRREILGLGRSRDYATGEVKRLRVTPVGQLDATVAAASFPLRAGGPLAFDYGPKTIRFGAGLEEGEATQLVERLADRLPGSAR